MRLQAIKLSGFKSFVDPTTVSFPSNLCAVVGPNGCGKSNIIDAVRWVMGESSAKTLRGESMADVIFSGSTTRKPVGQATIELIFDNAEGHLSGEYASYSELSIKRQVTRDGASNYFLNNSKCRRKDITDIFLGTGLGPRSYSIIEQGMISQLIEAKPEDLRVYIEEAAGISKYKERRKETERRISHTRENLDRLSDLREELERQLHHLERQSKSALKYSQFKEEERLVKSQLQALRWLAIDHESSRTRADISKLEIEREARIADERRLDAGVEEKRQLLTEKSDEMNEVQRQYYDYGTEIARIEESIAHQQQRNQQLVTDLNEVRENLEKVDADIEHDRLELSRLNQELDILSPKREQLIQIEQRSTLDLQVAESAMQDWQSRWDDFNEEAVKPSEQSEVQRARINHLEERIHRLRQGVTVLDSRKQELESSTLAEEIAPLQAMLGVQEGQIERIDTEIADAAKHISVQREKNQQNSEAINLAQSKIQEAKGRQASLEALQQAALGQQDDDEVQWLLRHGMGEARRLGEDLIVNEPWHQAVETVLGDHLQAVCVDDLGPVAQLLEGFDTGSLEFVETDVEGRTTATDSSTVTDDTAAADSQGTGFTGAGPAGTDTAGAGFVGAGFIGAGFSSNGATNSSGPGRNPSADFLINHVSSHLDLSSHLQGIRVAAGLAEALSLRKQLQAGESVITPEGIWLGKNWIRISREKDSSSGVIRRQEQLNMLVETLDINSKEAAILEQNLESGNVQLQFLETQRDEQQKRLAEQQRVFGETRAKLGATQVQVDRNTSDQEKVEQELRLSHTQLSDDEDSLKAAKNSLQDALDQMEEHSHIKEKLIEERDSSQVVLEEARLKSAGDRDEAHQLALAVQSLQSRLGSLGEAKQRLQDQHSILKERRQTLETNLKDGETPGLELRQELDAQLQKRLQVENQLTGLRKEVETTEHEIRAMSQDRSKLEENVEQIRSQLETLRIENQAQDVRQVTIREQLTEEEVELETVLANLPEEANDTEWDENLTKIGNRIQRLGAINLAAIDEFEMQKERKEYLDAQNDDLEEALKTLENAIRKIDVETRTRFKETFDKIDGKLQQLFPKLFGGGHAYLEMTGDDLLNTGVGLMARPPGKRNTSIHLLSGGEKALTAIALVFSIFSLNPAPFCLLDEVDAPLDDTNVGRYSDMVKEMSRTVQFVYITHNKLAMEMADQLMGVTMHEPGVSRLVSVDMDEAVAMVAV